MRTIRKAFSGALVAVLGAAAEGNAQESPPRSDRALSSGLIDRSLNPACTAAIPPASMASVGVYVGIDSVADPALMEVRAALQPFIVSAASHVRTAFGAEGRTLGRGEPRVTWKGAVGSLRVTAHRDGRVTWPEPLGDSVLTAGLRAVAAGLSAARDSGARISWPAAVNEDSAMLWLSLHTPTFDRKGFVTMPTLDRLDPLFQVMQPWLEATAAPAFRGPKYPVGPKMRGVTAILEFQLVIDSTGRADMTTVTEVWPSDKPRLEGKARSDHEEFAKSIRQYLKDTRFEPAQIGGCAVQQVFARQRFEFRMHGR